MDETNKKFELGGKTYKEGDWISIDGSTGNIYGEKIKTAAAAISGDFDRLMAWADKFRKLEVRTNADTPNDAAQAFAFGAEGIGLCRTEHMFFEADRITRDARDDRLRDRASSAKRRWPSSSRSSRATLRPSTRP